LATVGDQRQRDGGDWDEADDDGDGDRRLNGDPSGDAVDGFSSVKGSVAASAIEQPAYVTMANKPARQGLGQAELLTDEGENEVGARLGRESARGPR